MSGTRIDAAYTLVREIEKDFHDLFHLKQTLQEMMAGNITTRIVAQATVSSVPVGREVARQAFINEIARLERVCHAHKIKINQFLGIEGEEGLGWRCEDLEQTTPRESRYEDKEDREAAAR